MNMTYLKNMNILIKILVMLFNWLMGAEFDDITKECVI